MRTGKRVNHLIFCAVFVGTLLWPQLQSTTADTLPFLEPVDVFTRAVDVVQSMPLLNVDSQVTHNLYFRAPGAKAGKLSRSLRIWVNFPLIRRCFVPMARICWETAPPWRWSGSEPARSGCSTQR